MSANTETLTLPATTREIQLASRPHGRPVPENFRLAESPLPELQDGQVLVRNLYISVDPYMRGRMNDVKSYSAPFALDAALDGGAVGEVIASRAEGRAVGDTVVHSLGWREYAVVDAAATTLARTDLAPASAFLGALGMTGLTAYAGLLKVAEFKPGDVVFVSGRRRRRRLARGADRQGHGRVPGDRQRRLAGKGGPAARTRLRRRVQLPRRPGRANSSPRRRGSAGSTSTSTTSAASTLKQRCPCSPSAAGWPCAAPSRSTTPPKRRPRRATSPLAIGKQLTLKGFLVGGYGSTWPSSSRPMSAWLADGTVRYDETVVDGLENAPQAFMDLLDGANTGKMLVRL